MARKWAWLAWAALVCSCPAAARAQAPDAEMRNSLKGIAKVRVEVVFNTDADKAETAGVFAKQDFANLVTADLKTAKIGVIENNKDPADAIIRVAVTLSDTAEPGVYGVRFGVGVRQRVALDRAPKVVVTIPTWEITRFGYRTRNQIRSTITTAIDGDIMKQLIKDWQDANRP